VLFLADKEGSENHLCTFLNREQVVKTLLEISVEHSWAKVVHSKLICMLTNMLYQVPDGTQSGAFDTHFIPERIDLLGGVDYICLEVSVTLMFERLLLHKQRLMVTMH
jgi:hypothetical protein